MSEPCPQARLEASLKPRIRLRVLTIALAILYNLAVILRPSLRRLVPVNPRANATGNDSTCHESPPRQHTGRLSYRRREERLGQKSGLVMALVLEYIIRQGKSNWKQTVGAPEEEEAHLLESMHEEDLHGGPDLDEISLQLHSPPDSPPRLSTRRVRWADDEGLDDTYIDERPSRPIPRLSGDSGISMSFESFDSMRLAISRNSTFIKRKPVPTISSQDLAVTEVKRAHWTTLFDEKNLTLDSPEAQQTRTHASSAPSRNGRTHGRKRSITLCGPSLLAGSPTNSTWMPVGGVASGTAPVVITTTTSADVGQARASDEEHTSE